MSAPKEGGNQVIIAKSQVTDLDNSSQDGYISPSCRYREVYVLRQLHGRVIGHLLIILLLILSSDSKANKLTVVAEQLVPYQYQEQDQVIGLSVKLIEHVLQGADLKADINIYPWSRALMLAQTQPNTIYFNHSQKP